MRFRKTRVHPSLAITYRSCAGYIARVRCDGFRRPRVLSVLSRETGTVRFGLAMCFADASAAVIKTDQGEEI